MVFVIMCMREHVSHLMGRRVPAMVRAKWESAGATGLHLLHLKIFFKNLNKKLLHLQGGLTLYAGKQLTARLEKILRLKKMIVLTKMILIVVMTCTWMVGRRIRLFSARRSSPGFTSREATNRLQYCDINA